MNDDSERRVLSRVELLDLGDELLATMDADRERDIEVRPERVVNHAHLPTVYGLRQHVLRLGAVVVDLYRRDLTVESMVLVRLMYECAITAAWAADSREALPALANESLRQRRALSEAMRLSTSQVFRESADEIAHINDPAFVSSINTQGRQFKARCEALKGGAYAYTIYRALSAHCHASTHVVDPYLLVEGESAAVLRVEPEPIDHDSWLFLAVASMMWAARALDVIDRDHPHRNYLRGVARKLETNDVIRLTEAARAEEERAAQQRRRDARRPPRRRQRDLQTDGTPAAGESRTSDG